MGFPGGADNKESACSAQDPVPSLGREDLLAKGMAAHCSILAGEISWTEEPGGYSPCGRKEFERRTLT